MSKHTTIRLRFVQSCADRKSQKKAYNKIPGRRLKNYRELLTKHEITYYINPAFFAHDNASI
jgi:hypothetical protein